MKTETCSPAQHKIKYDVLDVKCLSFNTNQTVIMAGGTEN